MTGNRLCCVDVIPSTQISPQNSLFILCQCLIQCYLYIFVDYFYLYKPCDMCKATMYLSRDDIQPKWSNQQQTALTWMVHLIEDFICKMILFEVKLSLFLSEKNYFI